MRLHDKLVESSCFCAVSVWVWALLMYNVLVLALPVYSVLVLGLLVYTAPGLAFKQLSLSTVPMSLVDVKSTKYIDDEQS